MKNKKWFTLGLGVFLGAALLTGCGGNKSSATDDNDKKMTTVKIGVVGENNEVLESVKERLKDKNIDLEIISFSDYNQPNLALADGSLDLTSHQTEIFMEAFNKEHKTDIVNIGNTVNAPLGIYSKEIKDVSEIKKGDTIAIPNDVSNNSRALRLLESAGLIKVDADKGLTATLSDITENKLNLSIKEVDANQTARFMNDVTASVINVGMAIDAGLSPAKDAIYREPLDDNSRPFVNVIATLEKNKDNKVYNEVVDVFQTDETKKVIEETTQGATVPAWETFGRK